MSLQSTPMKVFLCFDKNDRSGGFIWTKRPRKKLKAIMNEAIGWYSDLLVTKNYDGERPKRGGLPLVRKVLWLHGVKQGENRSNSDTTFFISDLEL